MQRAFAVALITVPIVTFLTYAHVHADVLMVSTHAIRLPAILLTAVAMAAFTYASSAQPAVVEKNLDPVYEDGTKPPRTFSVVHEQTGVTVQFKWCYTCCSYRPPRSKHCRVCDRCVLRFDHHCPWIMNSVGLHNHRAFMIFLFVTVVHAAYEFILDIWILITIGNRWYNNIGPACPACPGQLPRETTVLVLVAHTAYLAFILYLVGQLAEYHMEVLMQNLTTNEDLTDEYLKRRNPFDKGSKRANCLAFWCGPRDPLETGELRPELDSE